MPFSAGQLQAVAVAIVSASSLSICGTVVVVLVFALFPTVRIFPLKLVLFLTLADALTSVANIYEQLPYALGWDRSVGSGASSDPTPISCIVGASMVQIGSVSIFLWNAAIGLNLARVVIWRRRRGVEPWQAAVHAVCWGLPVAFCVVLVAMNRFGQTIIGCWLKDTRDPLRFVFFYVPLFATMLFTVVVYVRCRLVFRRQASDPSSAQALVPAHERAAEASIQRQNTIYLVIFLLCWTPAVLNTIQNAIAPGSPAFSLTILHFTLAPLQGAIDAVAFLFSTRVREALRRMPCRQAYRRVSARRTGAIALDITPQTGAVKQSPDILVADAIP